MIKTTSSNNFSPENNLPKLDLDSLEKKDVPSKKSPQDKKEKKAKNDNNNNNNNTKVVSNQQHAHTTADRSRKPTKTLSSIFTLRSANNTNYDPNKQRSNTFTRNQTESLHKSEVESTPHSLQNSPKGQKKRGSMLPEGRFGTLPRGWKASSIDPSFGNLTQDDSFGPTVSPVQHTFSNDLQNMRKLKEGLGSEFSTSRDMIVKEIFTSEIAYAEQLELLSTVYYPCCEKLVTSDQLKGMFSNIEVIKNLGKSLLLDLSKRITVWNEKQTVADIFVRFSPFLASYNQYCNNYDRAIETYVSCLRKPNFSLYIKEQAALTQNGLGPDLQSLLIRPVQRIPRYILLLGDLKKNTPEDHPDYDNIEKAIQKIQEQTDKMNTKIKESDRSKEYETIITSVEGIGKWMAPHRKLLLTGSFQTEFAKGPRANETHLIDLYLFSDMLFFAKGEETKTLFALTALSGIWVITKANSSLEILTPTDALKINFVKPDLFQKWTELLEERFKQLSCEQSETRNFSMKFLDGSTYKGNWKTGTICGTGQFDFGKEVTYDGEWENGKPHGSGKLVFAELGIYEGKFKNGVPHGPGEFKTTSCTYIGDFKDGMRHKHGKMTWKNGDTYDGEFKKDHMNGFGTYMCSNGDKYEGEWKNSFRHGRGIFSTLISKYEGEWKLDKRNGRGQMFYASGETYVGDWKNGLYWGKGKYIGVSTVYIGDWAHGTKEGKGTMYYLKTPFSEKDWIWKYEGGFSHDTHNGQGTIISRDQKMSYEGSWKDGVRDGNGTLECDFFTYRGNFVFDSFYGSGTLSFDQDTVLIGNWNGHGDVDLSSKPEVLGGTLPLHKDFFLFQ